jgi:hypothetical protein
MNVVYVDKWRKRVDEKSVSNGFLRLDDFVRSRIIPPPIGTITFSFKTGKYSLCGDTSRVRGYCCEVLIADGEVSVIGNPFEAGEMVAHIEAEIEALPLVEPNRAANG